MPAVFVTATGTDIGKTFVTAGLARALRAKGRKVAVIKPVVSGFDPKAWAKSDPALLLEATGETPNLARIEAIAPWRYQAPLSPDMAARREGKSIDFTALVAFCRGEAEKAQDMFLIEGIGGLMVPLTPDTTVLDLIAALRIRSLLAAGTYVGSLSHTLTALAVMRHHDIRPSALVLNESPQSAASPQETADSLRSFHPDLPIVMLGRDPAPENVVAFAKLAEIVMQS
ncbi:MAG: dethiobiotin synthase [Methylovirgula sp.]|jgi:dethiobiotin synthetase